MIRRLTNSIEALFARHYRHIDGIYNRKTKPLKKYFWGDEKNILIFDFS